MKKKIDEIVKKVGDVKQKATEKAVMAGQEAIKHAGTVKGVVQVGVEQSKKAVEKAGQILTKDNFKQGLDVTSKGADLLAKGAKALSYGADTLAKGAEVAADKMKQFSDKMKK